MKRTVIAVVGAMLMMPSGLFAADSIREGYWEVTSQTEMPGMPMKIPATTIKHCYTKEDVKDQKKVIAKDKNCTLTDYKVAGNKVIWAMKCTGQSAGTFNGETIFSGDAYTSTMKMKTQGQNMTVKVKGKRIGECPKK
jgi:hypothetical protein